MKPLRNGVRYFFKRPIEFAPTEKLIQLKAELIAWGNSHLMLGHIESAQSARDLVNRINAVLKFAREHGRGTPNKMAENQKKAKGAL